MVWIKNEGLAASTQSTILRTIRSVQPGNKALRLVQVKVPARSVQEEVLSKQEVRQLLEDLSYRLLLPDLLSLSQEMIKLATAIKQSIGCSISFFAITVPSMANPYIKTFNQQLGTASTGEKVELLEVKVVIRGGYGTKLKYRIGNDIVESWIVCPEDKQPYFSDQGVRYAQSVATKKLLSLACKFEQEVLSSR